ncbi:MAG: hypothetical protein K8S16_10280 [Bacteroidales bacterium]|nr:hypothetical protein [Bacteroidales bacterium]
MKIKRTISVIITGIVSFGTIYLIPATGKLIVSLIQSVPITVGAKGILPAIIKIIAALLLWLLLYLLVCKRKNKKF